MMSTDPPSRWRWRHPASERGCRAGIATAVLLAGTLGMASCAGPNAAISSTPPTPAAWRELGEYRMLAGVENFECSVVGEGPEIPLSAVAFARLVLRDDASSIFSELARSERPAARVYGLYGLWFADRALCSRLAATLEPSDVAVTEHCGCLVMDLSFQDLAARTTSPDRRDSGGPVQLFDAGLAWLDEADPLGRDVETLRAQLFDSELSFSERERAAMALASSLGASGLEAAIRALPELGEASRSELLFALERVPPWSDGLLEVVARLLDHEDLLVRRGAVLALRALVLAPGVRADAHPLVPRLAEFLRATRRLDPDVSESEEERTLFDIVMTLSFSGGPAGPVLAEALGHPDAAVPDLVCETLQPPRWDPDTVTAFARQLENRELSVRAHAARCLLEGLDDGYDETPPPEVVSAIRARLPELRRAIATLEEEEREWLEQLLEERSG